MSQRQALPFDLSDGEEDFDFKTIPDSAENYLKQVIYERKVIPQVVVRPIPQKYQKKPDPVDVSVIITTTKKVNLKCILFQDESLKEPKKYSDLDPTEEWQHMQKEKFIDMQKKIVHFRSDPKFEDKIADEIFDIEEYEECIQYCQKNEPLLSVLLKIGQRELEVLIENISNHLTEQTETPEFLMEITDNDPNHWISKWIYSSLACLKIPLDPEMHSCLRVIAKSSIFIRDHFKSNPSANANRVLPWNLLITIIARNFHQFDLLK